MSPQNPLEPGTSADQSNIIQTKTTIIETQQQELAAKEAVIQELIRERDMMKNSKAWRLAERIRRMVYNKRQQGN